MHYETTAVVSAYAKAKCDGAKCKVSFNVFAAGDYQVLATDYVNYSVVYSCSETLGLKSELIWILSRSMNMPASYLTIAENVVKAQTSYSFDNFHRTKQGGECKYLA